MSNLTKVFWPDEGYTKGDLLAYYHNVASLIVPHLGERPLTMKRMPDGIDGPFFYEVGSVPHAGLARPLRRAERREERRDRLPHDRRRGRVAVHRESGLHRVPPLPHRGAPTSHTDYLFFDLDPFEPYTYEDVLVVARHIKVLLDQLGLPSFPKTSGATGLQIYARGARHLLLRHGPGVWSGQPDD